MRKERKNGGISLNGTELFVDALPEHTRYRDEGCDVSPSCLNCPLPQCKYDDPTAYYRAKRQSRNDEIRRLRGQGKRPAEIAREFGVTPRTVYRALKGAV
jgi:hypothetical protein